MHRDTKSILKLVVLIFPTLVLIDLIWIGVVAQGIYQDQIGYLLNTDIGWIPALLFYLLYSVAVAYFIVLPAIRTGGPLQALYRGLFFGLVAYATYDLTNLATIRDWPLAITLIDMLYGMIVTGIASAMAYMFGKKLIAN